LVDELVSGIQTRIARFILLTTQFSRTLTPSGNYATMAHEYETTTRNARQREPLGIGAHHWHKHPHSEAHQERRNAIGDVVHG